MYNMKNLKDFFNFDKEDELIPGGFLKPTEDPLQLLTNMIDSVIEKVKQLLNKIQ